jgi:hypothetical protein
MILIFGSALLTIFVIIQLAVHAESIGIIGAIIAACLIRNACFTHFSAS